MEAERKNSGLVSTQVGMVCEGGGFDECHPYNCQMDLPL